MAVVERVLAFKSAEVLFDGFLIGFGQYLLPGFGTFIKQWTAETALLITTPAI
jgi:hypothetical protein